MELASGENVFYPMPYVEGEPHLLIITNQRVVHFGDAGKQELPAKNIQFVGRMSGRPYVALGIILALFVALPMIGVGVYWIVTSGILSSVKVPVPIPGDDPSQPQGDAPEGGDDPSAEAAPPPSDSGVTKILGFVFVPIGLILIVVGFLLVRVQRHMVIVRGGQAVINIRAPSQMDQTQILATLGAVQTGSKGMAAAAAAAAPAAAKKEVKVDDKGDPLKALQDLSAARAAGKVSEDEFHEKREILLARVRGKK